MRKLFIKILLVGVLIVFGIGVFGACSCLDAQFEFEMSEEGYVITKYTGNGGAVILPEKYNGVKVVAVGEKAFSGAAITELTVPKTIKKVGFAAFENCTSLHTITTAFLRGDGESAETNTFKSWFGILRYDWDELVFEQPITINLTDYARLYEYVFYNVKTIKELNFQEDYGTNTIPACALTNTNLQKINNWPQINYIEMYAMGGIDIETIDFLDGVKGIGRGAFSCSSVKNLVLPASLDTIGDDAFAGCYDLESVTFEGNRLRKIGDRAFEAVGKNLTIVLPEGVTEIGHLAFNNDRMGRSCSITVYFPSTLNEVGKLCYFNPNSIERVNVYFADTEGWILRNYTGYSYEDTAVDPAILADPESAYNFMSYNMSNTQDYLYKKES